MEFPVRIIRKPGEGRYVEIKMDGKINKIGLDDKNPQQQTDIAYSLYRWKKAGYTGYPDFMERQLWSA